MILCISNHVTNQCSYQPALKVMLCISSVKSNLSLSPQQPVLTPHLFLCWRAIKYSSRVSSTVEAGFSP